MKKVRFLGIDMDVISEQEQASLPEDAVYVMAQVQDVDHRDGWPELLARRIITKCQLCRAACWLDPNAFGPTPKHVRRLCTRCVTEMVDKEAEA